MPQTNPTTPLNETMQMLTGLCAIGQQYCQDYLKATTAYLSDPSAAPERAGEEQIRAARTAVDEALALQRRCVHAWQRQLADDSGLWNAPRATLTATESAIDIRTGLWHGWFDNLEAVNRQDIKPLQDISSVRALNPFMPEQSAESGTTASGDGQATPEAARSDSARAPRQKRASGSQPSA